MKSNRFLSYDWSGGVYSYSFSNSSCKGKSQGYIKYTFYTNNLHRDIQYMTDTYDLTLRLNTFNFDEFFFKELVI